MIPSEELSKILNDVTRYDSNEPGLTENLFPKEIENFYSNISNNELNDVSIVVSYSNPNYKIDFYGDKRETKTGTQESDYTIYKGIFGIF